MITFFQSHRWLLSDPRFQREAKRQLSFHSAHLTAAQRKITATRAAIAKRKRARQLAVSHANAPQAVICRVFGSYCKEALAVARCESKLNTWAQNGQYLGLFQMGSSERRLFGHGPSVEEQVRAAYRYFVASGRDWSPWSCKPGGSLGNPAFDGMLAPLCARRGSDEMRAFLRKVRRVCQ